MTDEKEFEPSQLRFRPPEIEITDAAPFANDRLERQPFVEAVTDLLNAIREPFVVALNAPWGSGKTTTLGLLKPELARANITTVSFNAWEVDDATDPLVPLVAALHDRLLEIKGFPRGLDPSKIDRFKKLGNSILKHGAIAAVKAATAGFVDIGATAEGIAKAAGEAALKASEDLTVDFIENFKQERKAANQFRHLLEELIEYVRVSTPDGQEWPPLVLVIDELDRCRPTFAIAMLERIKHFFSVPGLVFVLALDLEQLKASTRKVYGDDLDATEYLRRFVDLELRLPRADLGNMVNAMLTSCGADSFFKARSNYTILREDREWIVTILKNLAHHFDLSPRVIQRMVSRLMLVVRQTASNGHLDPIIVVFLIFLRMHDEQMLRRLVTGKIQADQAMAALQTVSPGGEAFYNSHAGMMIEANLLYAHYSAHHEYVASLMERANTATATKSAEDVRLLEVCRRYEILRNTYFSRSWIDLREIDRRINLVATDLKEDR
ncbi:KAP family NTPase [Achromobacter sp. MY14]|uniref:KAP family P-loop NTPase fold protein n=1 Tax=unclassified Achromobacter TaxID=2626865 RepID=UPI001E2ABC40|nr:P-loop NTPase fold protein [Achromobacter sp. MY14]MCD0496919.1 KAP family NTPase [Achromobacter sp. MY14]